MNRLIQLFTEYATPLAIVFGVVLLVASVITGVMFKQRREESSDGGSPFINILWLSIGLGMVSALICLVIGSLLWLIPVHTVRSISRILRHAAKFACAPDKFKFRHSHNQHPLSYQIAFFVLFGLWFGAFEIVLGVLYCCTILGIHIGKNHIRLGRVLFFPALYRMMNNVDYEDYCSSRLMEGR